MSSKSASRRHGERTSAVKLDIGGGADDILRRPDSDSDSADSDRHSADLPTTNFVRGSTKLGGQLDTKKQPIEQGWEAKREASRLAATERHHKKLSKDNNSSSMTDQVKGRGARIAPLSSQTTNTAKRKNGDRELDVANLGQGMGDSFGRVNSKKPKVKFGKPKSVKKEPLASLAHLPSDDENNSSVKFRNPEPDNRPKKRGLGGFITPNQDTSPKTTNFNMPEGFKVSKRPSTPVEEESQFIMPEEVIEEPSQGSNSYVTAPTLHEETSLNSSQAIDAILQDDELGLGEDAIKDVRSIVAAEGSAVAATRDFDYTAYFATQMSRCPICKQEVNEADLRAFGYMNIKKQEKFCRAHRIKTAEEEWKVGNYPTIDWKMLDSRIAKHHSFIKEMINGEDSHFRSLLGDRIQAGQDRTTMTMKTNLTPGYYGTRGLQIISENIMQEFAPLLKKRMVQDRLMSSRGFAPYVQAVLVPEVTVRLIMEDMKVDEQEAKDILVYSAVVGELLNEEVRDVVRKKVEHNDESDG